MRQLLLSIFDFFRATLQRYARQYRLHRLLRKYRNAITDVWAEKDHS